MNETRRGQPRPGPLAEWRFGLAQAARVGWFQANYWAAQQVAPRPVRLAPARHPLPPPSVLRQDLLALLRRDRANVRAGYYPAPTGEVFDLRALAAGARAFFADLPAVVERRRAGAFRELPSDADAGLPGYYRQNFHFQTDGYLSPRSAELYDYQVDVLFGGCSDAMRRQALPILFRRLRRRPAARILDLGCGTGRFLQALRGCLPQARLTGLDLSADYLATAGRALAGDDGIALLQANAERPPLADGSFDAVTAVYLFHELPRGARETLVAAAAALLKPGGLFLLADSLQFGDFTPYDGLLERFPTSFHEPFHADYCRQDLTALFGRHGLVPVEQDRAFMTRLALFAKP